MRWHDVAGGIGVALIVLAFLLLQLERLSGNGLAYLAANAIGAALILLSLFFEFNAAAFVVEAFWLAICVFGMARRMREPA